MNREEWSHLSAKCKGNIPRGNNNLCIIDSNMGMYKDRIHSMHCNYVFCIRLNIGGDWYEHEHQWNELIPPLCVKCGVSKGWHNIPEYII